MLIYRLERDNHKPPPSYGLKSYLLTLCIHHSGEFIHIPDGSYEGGSVCKFDYVNISEMKKSKLLLLCEGVGVRSISNFYFLINGGFKLVRSDVELSHMFFDKMQFREMHIYADTRVYETDSESYHDSIGDESERVEEFSDSDCDLNSEAGSDEEYKIEKINHLDDELYDENVDAAVVDLIDELSSDGIDKSEGMGGDEMNTTEKDNSDGTTGDSRSETGDEDIIESGDDFGSAPDSDDETIGHKFDVFNHVDMYNPSFNFKLGMKFSTKKDLRKMITSHAVMNRRNVFIVVSDKKRLYARCRGKRCNWEVRARKVLGESTWQITEYPREVHKCAKASRVRNMKSTWVAERFIDRFKSDPKRHIPGFVKDVALETKCIFTEKQGYRAKKLAMEMIEGDSGAQYSLLWDYRDEVLRSNPGSTVLVGSDDDGLFDRMYVCLSALKNGFLSGCRPILGVDGCHLWGPYKGVLLTAVGIDPNNNIFPLAWAIVTKENYDNWRWFLSAIRVDLGIEHHETWTFMSDKQKGLLLAFDEVFKDANNRFCVRHLHGNFKKAGFGGMALKEVLWKAARASTVNAFKRHMEEMKQIDPKSIEWFDDKPASQWSKSHFNNYPKCDMLLNNGCETFNKVIKVARDKPILTLLEWLHDYNMTRFQTNRDRASNKWNGLICPKIKALIEKYKDGAANGIALKSNDMTYKVEMYDNSTFVVNLEARSCACRKWDITGIPCIHAICALNSKEEDPLDYVHLYYQLETYKSVYKFTVYPINGRSEWAKSNLAAIKPPNEGKVVGRPGGARRLEAEEVPSKKKKGRHTVASQSNPKRLKRQQVTVKCSHCKEAGHNKRSCVRRKDGLPAVQEQGNHQQQHEVVNAVQENTDVNEDEEVADDMLNILKGDDRVSHSQPPTSDLFSHGDDGSDATPAFKGFWSQGILTSNPVKETTRRDKAPTKAVTTKVTRATSRRDKASSSRMSKSISSSRTSWAATSSQPPPPSSTALASQLLHAPVMQTPPTMHQQITNSQLGLNLTQMVNMTGSTMNQTFAVSGPLPTRPGVDRPLFSSQKKGKSQKK